MQKRLEYIDAIKGIAIFLVVMGHVLAWVFPDNVALGAPDSPSLIWRLIYSFHMPLFIFVSGFLFGHTTFESLGSYLQKVLIKARFLLVPYFICGTLLWLWRGGRHLTYWYLLTLFLLYLIVGFLSWISGLIKNQKVQPVIELLALSAIHIGLYWAAHHIHAGVLAFSDWFIHLSQMFPYFAAGYLSRRYLPIERLLNDYAFVACVILFIASFAIPLQRVSFYGIGFVSFSAIYAVFYICVKHLQGGKGIAYFKRLGMNTLPIYLLHLFFTVRLICVGNYCMELTEIGKDGVVTSFVIQLFYGLLVSAVLIELSLVCARLIRTSKPLSFLLLGEPLNK